MRVPKGFLALGAAENWLNISYIDQSKCFYDKKLKLVAVIDVFGNRYNVPKKLCKNKIQWRS